MRLYPRLHPAVLFLVFRRALDKFGAKSVKKTLSIPEWLNDAAVKENINFSQVLQEALKDKLNVS